MRVLPLAAVLCLTQAAVLPATAAEVEKGTVHFTPLGDQKEVPERYRLQKHDFTYEMTPASELSGAGVRIFNVTYPTALESDCPQNNTVYCEYFRPRGSGPFPGVVVLDVIGGKAGVVSRSIATHLAHHGIAALFMQMPYYGPRRLENSRERMISFSYLHTVQAIRQCVLDARRATAWLASRPEIDRDRLGILGTSLGSFMGSLTAEMEPRLRRVVLLLGGGGLVDGYYDDPRARGAREMYEALGGTREKLAKLLAPVDPLTCAANLKDRRVLLIAGKRDEIVLPKMTEALWHATGEQKLVWFDCTHVGLALHIKPALDQVVKHLTED